MSEIEVRGMKQDAAVLLVIAILDTRESHVADTRGAVPGEVDSLF